MIAELVPYSEIPNLAARVTPEMLDVLMRIQSVHSIQNSRSLDTKTVNALTDLLKLGLVDAGYEAPSNGTPYNWVSNGNGRRVLSFLTGIRGGPHYEISAAELAEWLEEQGKNLWWNVDGDPLLTGRMTFPCPAWKLARELRTIDRPLLVQAKKEDNSAIGQAINKDKLNQIVGRFADTLHVLNAVAPRWSDDRILNLHWKHRTHEWLLVEDSQTTKQMSSFGSDPLGDTASQE